MVIHLLEYVFYYICIHVVYHIPKYIIESMWNVHIIAVDDVTTRRKYKYIENIVFNYFVRETKGEGEGEISKNNSI